MIVSDLESVVLRVLFGAVLECSHRDRSEFSRIRDHVDALLQWGEQPGVTDAARIEIAEGEEVRKL